MEDMSLELGRMSKKFHHAEGWRRHLHFGFAGLMTIRCELRWVEITS